MTGIAIAILLVIYIGYLLFIPKQLVSYRFPKGKEEQFEILTKKVKAGESVVYRVDRCAYVHATTFSYRAFVGDREFIPYPVTASVVEPGCIIRDVYIPVPAETPPGMYYLQFTAEWHLDPIGVKYLSSRTEVFEVVK